MITENVDDIFVIYDIEQGKVEFVSLNVERILGIPEKEYMKNERNWMLADNVDEDTSKMLNYLYESKKMEDVVEAEYSAVNRKTGEKRLLRTKLYPVFRKNGKVAKLLSMTHDITRDKEAKELLENALMMAESANDAKRDFLSRMSHEIRTPINAIVGMRAIAELSVGDEEKTLECLHKIDIASKHLLGLVNDVLDMSRLERGKVKIVDAAFDLDRCTETVLTLIYMRANEKKINIAVEKRNISQKILVGDELRIRQILSNFLTNAVKFSPEGSEVRLVLEQHSEDKDGINTRFTVIDSGPGIRKEFMGKLFEPFEQDRVAVKGHTAGSGLGMAICKNLAMLMGGEISVESKPGEGSAFSVDIRLEKPAGEAESCQDKGTYEGIPDLTGIRVLVAEDNAINMEIMEELLSAAGCEVEQAYDGRQAVEMYEAAADGWYDVIMMDIQMPVMDGESAIGRIRSSKKKDARSVVIIAMTANETRDGIIFNDSKRMNARIAKPINPQTMYGTIKQLRENRKDGRYGYEAGDN